MFFNLFNICGRNNKCFVLQKEIHAIMKVVFDRINSLKPWGLLLGDEKDEKQPPNLRWKLRRKKMSN